jgi:hypothetical protein
VSRCSSEALRRASLNNFVGEQLDRVRHLDAEHSRRLQINDELELGRLRGRQLGRIGTLENLTAVAANLTIHVQKIGPVAHQPTDFDNLASGIGCGNPMVRRQRSELDAPIYKEPVGGNEESVSPIAREGGEGCLDLATGAGVEDLSLQAEGAGRFRSLAQGDLGRLLAGLTRTPIRTALGTKSCSSPTRLAITSLAKKLMPVALPPGRPRLATRPNLAGSSPTANAIGIVVVAALAANAAAKYGDNGHVALHEVGHERRQAIVVAVQPVVLDRHVLALDVSGFGKAF